MEKIQRQSNLCCLDQNLNVRRSLQVQESVDHQILAIEEDRFINRSLQDTSIPFLQMLQQSDKDSNIHPWENYQEANEYYHNPYVEGVISSQELPFIQTDNANSRHKRKDYNSETTSITKEKRKRKRSKPMKNIEEMESQRMTHIAVERNRRKQMNVHLNSLKSLIPPSYIQRGDQASIVGGAIDFVKILEQHLQSLETQKITQWCVSEEEEIRELKIDATVIESHVNLKIQCLRKQGELVRSIILLEKLGFTVLHLNITSPSDTHVSYSFNLKMEDDCNLASADEIKEAVRQIFECRLFD